MASDLRDHYQDVEGVEPIHVLRGHDAEISILAWSPDGTTLASGSDDGTIRLWDVASGTLKKTLTSLHERHRSIAWSRDGRRMASSSQSNVIHIWNCESGEIIRDLHWHKRSVNCVDWSPDGMTLASGSCDYTIRLWGVDGAGLLGTIDLVREVGISDPVVHAVSWSPTGEAIAVGSECLMRVVWRGQVVGCEPARLVGASYCLAWSKDGQTLASGGKDGAIRLWDRDCVRPRNILEGHLRPVRSVVFSPNGDLLLSSSDDGSVRIWRLDVPASVVEISAVNSAGAAALAFHPCEPLLAIAAEHGKAIHVCRLDTERLSNASPLQDSRHYRNAKVVLIGDTGVGKSALAMVLTHEHFRPTDSTHGRRVHVFDSHEWFSPTGHSERREALLWDLAGQPSYRLIHQLSLSETSVALIVFDARSQADPFAAVKYWHRALEQAIHAQGDALLPPVMLLVAARTDRGRVEASRERVNEIVGQMGFDGYFETSAKEGWQIDELRTAIRRSINWEAQPQVASNAMFEQMKEFVLEKKHSGHVLSTADELYLSFRKAAGRDVDPMDLRPQFDVCLGRLEARGLVRRLSFGALVLLEPERLDSYAAGIVMAATANPEGLGCLNERDVQAGRFEMSRSERLDERYEELLLPATTEDLLRHEIALREDSDQGPYLVFPSQFTREWEKEYEPTGVSAMFRFEGPVMNIYATLAVRLAHSGVFEKQEMRRNGAIYRTAIGPREDNACGISLRVFGDGTGELDVFFDRSVAADTREYFEKFVDTHLARKALNYSLQRPVICDKCGAVIPADYVHIRRERGVDWGFCAACDQRVSLALVTEIVRPVPSTVADMGRAADTARERAAATAVIEGKRRTKDFDVFLCHNSADKPFVKEVARRLMDREILPWLDEWNLRPGQLWQKELESQITSIKSAAVFVGGGGIGPWQDMEMAAFLRQLVKRGSPVIPTILRNANSHPELPAFMEGLTWVDFRVADPDPLQQLLWGITGERFEE